MAIDVLITPASGTIYISGSEAQTPTPPNLTNGTNYLWASGTTLQWGNQEVYTNAPGTSEITGGGSANQVAYYSASTTITGSSNLTFDGNHLKLLDDKKLILGTGDDMQIYHNGSNSYVTSQVGDLNILNTANDADIKFKIKDNTVETEVMRIVGATSKIGIGTDAPDEKLDVRGDIQLKQTGDTAVTVLGDANRTNADAHVAALRGKWNGTAVGTFMVMSGPDTTNKDDGQLTFQTASAGTLAERMRIDETGSVGIGTTEPSHHLHVVGNGMFTGGVTVGDSSADTFTTRGHTHLATLGNNVGIGTTGPNAKLEVRSTSNPQIRVSYNDSHHLDIYASNGTGYIKSDGRFRASSSTARYFFHGNATSTGRAEMFISAGGDIANKRMSSFLYLLRGYEGKDGAGIYFGEAVSGSNNEGSTNSEGREGTQWYAGLNYAGGGATDEWILGTDYRTTSGSGADGYTPVIAAQKTNTYGPQGKVGINILNPQQPLHVLTSANDQGILIDVGDDAHEGRLLFGDTSSNAIGHIGYNHSLETMRFTVGGYETVRMANDGSYSKLFLGGDSTLGLYRYSNRMDFYISSNPRMHLDASKLYSATSGGPLLDLTPTAGEANYAFVDDVDSGLTRSAANTIHLLTAGVSGMTMDSSQNVGIGTVAPEAKLDVRGSVIASGNIDTHNRVRYGPSTAYMLDFSNTSTGLTLAGYQSFRPTVSGNAAGNGQDLGMSTYPWDKVYSQGLTLSNQTGGDSSPGAKTIWVSGSDVYWGTSKLNAQSGGGGGGDITAVTAGTNLNGGGSTGDVTLNLDTNITGDITFDTNVLAVDSSNNRVGIGTAVPGYLLDIRDSVSMRFEQSNSQRLLFFGQNDHATIHVTGSSHKLALQTGGPGVEFQDAAGNHHLTVLETGTNGARIHGPALVQLKSDADSVYISAAEHNYFDVGAGATYSHIWRDDTNGETMRLKNGQLGIGTTSPNSELDVFGDIRITNKNGSNPTDAGSLIFEEAGDNWGSSLFGFRINLEGDSNYLNFQSANQSTIKDVLTLTRDTARVGIGTTSPAFALDVNGDIRVEDSHYLRFGGDGASDSEWIIQNTAGNNLNFGEVGVADNVLLLEAGGKVGMGTSNPDGGHLHIYTAVDQVLKMESSDANTDAVFKDTGGSGIIRFASNIFKFYTAADYSVNPLNINNADVEVTNALSVTGPTLAVQKTMKNDLAGTHTLSDSYSHYMATADNQGVATCTITTPATADSVIGDEYFIVAQCIYASAAPSNALVQITPNTGQTINQAVNAGSNIAIHQVSSGTGAGGTPLVSYKTAHLICVDTGQWVLTISDVGPTS
jgi:hypothetical protein